LIVLACTRLPPTASGTVLWRLLMELWSTGRCVMRRLKPLSEDDVRQTLVDRFESEPLGAIAPALHRLTGGTALALPAVMRALVAGEIIARGPNGWQLRPPAASIDGRLPESAR